MSSDPELERLLRDARNTLPEPDGLSSNRARALALESLRPRGQRGMRITALLGVALAVALAVGIGLGALLAPSGEAAKGPIGLGFLPQPGWYALQAETGASPMFQTIAAAANVPFAREDDVAGVADPSGLPYATLLKLPADGIVIVASFIRQSSLTPFDRQAAGEELPLDLSAATPDLTGGRQLRPDEPLGQLEVHGTVNGYYINVTVYFGTPTPSAGLRSEAQGQLEGLVVTAPPNTRRPTRRAAPSAGEAAPGTIDRTYLCAPTLVGGTRQIDVRAHGGSRRRGASWDSPPFASVSTTVSGSVFTAIEDELVWVTAGRPSEHAGVVGVFAGANFPIRTWGTVAVNGKRCRATKLQVPRGRKGLDGGAVGAFDDRWDCATGGRVVVHVRAVLAARASLKSYRGFLRTTVPVKTASLAVRTQSGRALAYAEVFESGKSTLFTAPGCFPD